MLDIPEEIRNQLEERGYEPSAEEDGFQIWEAGDVQIQVFYDKNIPPRARSASTGRSLVYKDLLL